MNKLETLIIDGEDICEWMLNGKCMHCWSEGELDCNGTIGEQKKCLKDSEII